MVGLSISVNRTTVIRAMYYVYILASRRSRDVCYIGVTNYACEAAGAASQWRGLLVRQSAMAFTASSMSRRSSAPDEAIAREKQLKRWKRDWKIELIERENLEWRDLSDLIGLDGITRSEPSIVVPANAGTHTPCPDRVRRCAKTFAQRTLRGYGSLRSQGRRADEGTAIV